MAPPVRNARTAGLLLALATVCGSPASGRGTPPPQQPGWTRLDRTLLVTTYAVVGRLTIEDVEQLERAAQRNGGYVTLRVRIDEVLRPADEAEELPRHRKVMFFATPEGHPHGYQPTADSIRRHLGKKRLILLQQVGSRLFLASRSDETALQPVSNVPDVNEALRRHAQYAERPLPEDVPQHRLAAQLIEDLAGDDEEAARDAWQRLNELELEAVPALARHLDDERPTSLGPVVVMERQADGSERTRLLTPGTVRDVLLLTLPRISDERFLAREPMAAGPRDLKWATRAWRIYAHHLEATRRARERRFTRREPR